MKSAKKKTFKEIKMRRFHKPNLQLCPNTKTLKGKNKQPNHFFETLSSIASSLLKDERIEKNIHEILKTICTATGAVQAFWLENHEKPAGTIYTDLKAKWPHGNTQTRSKNSAIKPFSIETQYPSLFQQLKKGDFLIGTTKDFPFVPAFSDQMLGAILIVPLLINDTLKGLLGFRYPSKKTWPDTGIHFICSVVNFIAKALEHEKSINELKESESRYHDIFENIDDAWYLHDMDGRFLEVNPAFEKATGYSKDELLLKTVPELIPERYRHQFFSHLNELKKKNRCESLIRLITKDGEERIGNFRSWIVHLPGGKLVSRGLIRDVTDSIKLQAQLRHAQRMESMGTLVSGISHNFRNILSGTMSYSQLIQMKYKQVPELQKYTHEIIALSKAGSDLIADLLKFSRKAHSEKKAVINLAEVLRETHHIIEQSFDKNIIIRTDWHEVIPIYADQSSLSQVFMNLCTNARDAMPQGGTLEIKVAEIKNQILVSVIDSGTGMDDKIIQKIFDPFFTTKEPGKGTGLGLSTAYGIIKDLGGEIRVFSQTGKGSTFEVLLPRLETTNYSRHKPMPRIVSGSGEKILIVDDDELLLEPISELFSGLGYQTAIAANGKKAVEQYKEWHPDLVLLDRNMPDLDGLATAQIVLSLDPAAKIILVSGYEDEGPDGLDDRIRKMIKGYLTKPLDIEQTSKLVAKVLKK